jgi:hypothetical protein
MGGELYRHVQWLTRRKIMEPEEFASQLNHTHLVKAYLRLAAESKKIKESPGVTAVRGEAPKPQRKKKPKVEQPVEQMRMF